MKKRLLSLVMMGSMLLSGFMITDLKVHATEGVYVIAEVEYKGDGTVSENSMGTSSFGITGIIQDDAVYDITTLDVTVPIDGLYFNIDRDGTLYSQGMVIESNTSMPLNVDVIKVKSVGIGDTTDGQAETTVSCPALVPASKYTADEWNNLSPEETMKSMALSLKQVDVVDGIASESLTDLTTDSKKVTTPVQLGDLSSNYRLAHIESGYDNTVYAGINIEKDVAYTNYGKYWIGENGVIFRYIVTLEFSY